MTPAAAAMEAGHLGYVAGWLDDLGRRLGAGDLRGHLGELLADRAPLDELERAVAGEPHFRKKRWRSVLELGLYRLAGFALVRATRPEVFLETGVLHGLTSHLLLSALRRNGQGRLVSVDLPSRPETGPANRDGFTDVLPPGRDPGWVVPTASRRRWTLVLGRSLEVMPALLARLGTIDVFLHDSAHTPETMLGEMELAWPRLRAGGLLLCDNVTCNDAFATFSRRVGRRPVLVPEGIRPGPGDPIRFGAIAK